MKAKTKINQVNTVTDIRKFFEEITNNYNIAFHPDNSFHDYVNLDTDMKIFSKTEADRLNRILMKCFIICANKNKDIYDLCLSVLEEYEF
jgi:uncharacterized protein YpuA (DUF1002 family)